MNARIEARIARLHRLYPRLIDLSLERLARLLAALGNPEARLGPVIHVAGTNGKGSVVAFLRAIAEAGGLAVNVYTSPHLVVMNERFRLRGRLVSDAALDGALAEVEDVNGEAPITVFEVLTAAAFLLFARAPADLSLIEVGLGGRFDATNLIPAPAAAAITSISLDHKEFLGETLGAIAFEKAGIIKPAAPVVTGAQEPQALAVIAARAEALGTALHARFRDWDISSVPGGLRYRDAEGSLELPPPALAGPFQHDNAGIAVAALRAGRIPLPARAFGRGLAGAEWPARLQRLTGRLAALLPADAELWLDGGHNPGAGQALAAHLASWRGRPLHLVVGMKNSKDAAEFLRPLIPFADTLWAVAEPGQHLAMPIPAIIAASGGVAEPGPRIRDALAAIARRPGSARVLICGSLYLAGEVLKADASGPALVAAGT